jgi:hypothetical protein
MINSLLIVAFAALIHASFQLSVSMLTLLSGHAIGTRTAHARLLRLTNGFLLGTGVMTLLVLSFLAFLFQHAFGVRVPMVAWACGSGILLGLGIAVWAFYYRREQGTTLWLPRGIARFITERTKATRRSSEAFSLGLSSVIGELIFILAPMSISALVLVRLDSAGQLAGLGIYTVVSLLSLLIVCSLIGSGHKLSRIQKWREDNKRFLQFAAGSGLLVLGAYIYVDRVVSVAALAHGGY